MSLPFTSELTTDIPTGSGDALLSDPIPAETFAEPLSRFSRLLNPRFLFALLDQGVVSFGNMVIAASFARHSPAAAFGMFILALRSLDAIGQVAGVLIWGPYIFNVQAMDQARRRQYLGSVLLHQCAASILGVLALLLLGVVSLHSGHNTYAPLFLPLMLPSIAIVFREFTRRIYFASLRFRDALITDSITVALQVAGILLLIHRHALTLSSALWVLSAVCAVISIFWLITEAPGLVISFRAVREDFRLNLELGRWFFGSNMVLLASAQVSPWILSASAGTAAVGAFAVCESVVNIPRVALTSMQNAMGPMMARDYANGGRTALRQTVRRMDLLLLGGSIAFALLIMSLGPWIAHAIFHQTPPNVRPILIFLALNLVVYAASLAQSYALSSMKLAKLNFHPQVAGLVVQLILVALLVHRMGVPGVALALLLSSIVVLAVRAVFYQREIRRA